MPAKSERVTIAENSTHFLKSDFPKVETYPHVDTDLLYKGDDDPFHITLPIAEIGRVSDNGLEYDSVLVNSIAEQMQKGAGGIRGHIPDSELSTAFPPDAVHWIGHVREQGILWAKGYIPPGLTRDDLRRKKARGGTVGTSIFGNAVKETSKSSDRNTWKAREFVLEQIDLAPPSRAALKHQQGFEITREMQEGEEMPDVREITSVAEVPVAIREQIIKEAEVAAKVEKVAEMQTKVAELDTQVKELAQYKSIVAEIRTTLGENADIPTLVAEYYGAISKLTTMLGVKDVASISVRVEEMQTVVAEFAQKAFEGTVDTQIAEFTKWDAKTDTGKAKVTNFRKSMKRAVVAELGSERAPEKIAETAKKLWDEEFSLIGQSVVAELGGPSAFVPGRANPAAAGKPSGPLSEEDAQREASRLVKK